MVGKRVILFGLSANPPTGLGGHMGIAKYFAGMIEKDLCDKQSCMTRFGSFLFFGTLIHPNEHWKRMKIGTFVISICFLGS